MKPVFEMTGVERSAALLVALGPEIASDIFKHLDEENIEKISLEIARIDRLSPGEREDLIGEFIVDLRKARSTLYGGENKARELLVQAFGNEKTDELLNRLVLINPEKEFEFLKEADPEIIISILKEEQVQTIAVALSFLPSERTALVIDRLEKKKAKEIIVRMAKMESVNPEAAAGIATVLKKRYREQLMQKRGEDAADGVSSLSEILSYMSRDEESRIIRHLELSSPGVSDLLNKSLFVFEKTASLSNSEIRILIDEINDDALVARALKGAGDDVRFKFLRNMSQNRATDILNDMNAIGPIKLKDVEECRNRIVETMRQLHSSGLISLRGDREVYVD
jgi:flagellar motor switch protein FliG